MKNYIYWVKTLVILRDFIDYENLTADKNFEQMEFALKTGYDEEHRNVFEQTEIDSIRYIINE